MRPTGGPVLLTALLLLSSPASAWELENDAGSDPVGGPAAEPAAEPGSASAEGAPVEPPAGVYLVTDTYSADVVTRAGSLTTYETVTIHESTGSYARVLETVGTGGSSVFDGAAFNGRAMLTDGRSVAGTYYENYVRTNDGFLAVSIVFFQDDSEIAQATARVTPIIESGSAATNAGPAGVAAGPGDPGMPGRPDRDGPINEREPAPVTKDPLPDRTIEVLRGRRIALWFTDAGIRGWRYVAGDATVLGALAGGGGEPFRARWDRLAPVGRSWALHFVVDFSDGGTRDLVVRVTVRAPGLVE